ncbi:MAG: hypothetical protein K2J90_10895 [Lachnospiraceae bacterium]|nr:hypothetical protein [Lachnospiraceae bacterium]
MKKYLFALGLCAVLVLSVVSSVLAASAKKGDYKMKYDLYSAKVGGASGAGAMTAEDSGKGSEVYAFASVYSYKGSTVKNSAADTKVSHVTVAIAGKGGNTYKSYHNLKNDDYRPIGNNLTLTK